MNQMLEAAIWFWIPLCLIPLGMWFLISGKAKTLGKIISAVGLLLVLASSWTVLPLIHQLAGIFFCQFWPRRSFYCTEFME